MAWARVEGQGLNVAPNATCVNTLTRNSGAEVGSSTPDAKHPKATAK